MIDIQQAMSELWRVYKVYRSKALGKNKAKVLEMIYLLIEEMEAEIEK